MSIEVTEDEGPVVIRKNRYGEGRTGVPGRRTDGRNVKIEKSERRRGEVYRDSKKV